MPDAVSPTQSRPLSPSSPRSADRMGNTGVPEDHGEVFDARLPTAVTLNDLCLNGNDRCRGTLKVMACSFRSYVPA
jgi:hypothetical protein